LDEAQGKDILVIAEIKPPLQRIRSGGFYIIGRVQRQGLFLHALESQMLHTGTLFKLPALVTTLYRYVHTDMNIYIMVKLAETLKDVEPENLHTA